MKSQIIIFLCRGHFSRLHNVAVMRSVDGCKTAELYTVHGSWHSTTLYSKIVKSIQAPILLSYLLLQSTIQSVQSIRLYIIYAFIYIHHTHQYIIIIYNLYTSHIIYTSIQCTLYIIYTSIQSIHLYILNSNSNSTSRHSFVLTQRLRRKKSFFLQRYVIHTHTHTPFINSPSLPLSLPLSLLYMYICVGEVSLRVPGVMRWTLLVLSTRSTDSGAHSRNSRTETQIIHTFKHVHTISPPD
jgi:hypothetical protein